MIDQDLISTELGSVLHSLGWTGSNAALWVEGDGGISEAQVLEKWEEIKAKRASDKASQSAYDAALSAGFDTGLGFKMSVTQYAQGRLTTLKAGIDVLGLPDTAEVPVWDQSGAKQLITVGQFKTMLQGYTLHCIAIEP